MNEIVYNAIDVKRFIYILFSVKLLMNKHYNRINNEHFLDV